MTEDILYKVSAQVAEISFNRPQRLNAVTQQLYDQLAAALQRAQADAEVRVVVLSGQGRAFCVGADMKEHQAGRSAFERRQYLMGEQQVCKSLLTLSKPVVAAVNGYALGAGAEMALACDFILMADSAQIGFPEISIGNFLGGGVTWLLPRIVGLARARELVFLGERLSGAQAAEIGLANRHWPDAEFPQKVQEFAAQLASRAPFSMELAKRQLLSSAQNGLDAALVAELEGMTFTATTADWQEGVDAFAARRAPVFQGK